MMTKANLANFLRFSKHKKHNLQAVDVIVIDESVIQEDIKVENISQSKKEVKSAKERDRERLRGQKKLKEKKEKRKLPRNTIETIPYKYLEKYNITQLEKGLYSKTYSFNDINYQIAQKKEKENIFVSYRNALNYFDTTVDIQVSIINERINAEEFSNRILIPMADDKYNHYREEYNNMLRSKLEEGNNDIIQKKFFTVTVREDNLKNAKSKLDSIENELKNSFVKMHSTLSVVENVEKVDILKNIFRERELDTPNFSQEDFKKQIEKKFISPDYFEFKRDYFMFNDKYARSMFLKGLPSSLNDKFLTDLSALPIGQLLSINISSMDSGKAQKVVKKKITDMQADIARSQKQASKAGYAGIVNLELEHSLNEAMELFEDMKSKNQKMFQVDLVVTLITDSYDELQLQTNNLKSIASKHICELSTLHFQQEDGLTSSLPLGKSVMKIKRSLTSEAVTVLMPFNIRDLIQESGSYYGMNPISKNLIVIDRTLLKNPNGFILGVPGSGKSFTAKREMFNVFLNTNDDIIIIDPEREYGGLVTNLGGEIIDVSAGSKNYINPLDMSETYADIDDPITLKSDFILSLCELLIGGNIGLSPKEKTIIDRCLKSTYGDYIKDFDKSKIPTLEDFYNKLLKQKEQEAEDIAIALEIYIKGSLNLFAHKTNVDVNNRLTSFDIKDLGSSLKTMGMLIVLDYIWNKITQNKQEGRNTWIYMDEIYVLFNNEYSAQFLFQLYKRARKWGGIPTGITQNVEDLLKSDTARNMLSNTEFVQMLSQAPSDREELSKLLKISEDQMSYVTNSSAGSGLIDFGGAIIPFEDKYPTDTDSYRMMSTKFSENKKQG